MPTYPALSSSIEAKTKRRHYATALPAFNANFFDGVVDVYGRVSKQFSDLIGALASHASLNRDYEGGTFKKWLKQELSVTLQRGNALMIEESCTRALSASADAYRKGT